MVKTKAALEEIERDVGATSMFLQAGEYDLRAVKAQLANVRELIDKLHEIAEALTDKVDRVGEDCSAGQDLLAVLMSVDDGLYALGEAEDCLLDLEGLPGSRRLATQAIDHLDKCCGELTKAITACKET